MTGYGEKGFRGEKVFTEINCAICNGQIHQVQRTDTKQLASPLTIAGGDKRCVYPVKVSVKKIAVYRVSQSCSDAGNGAKGVGSRSQVSDASQVLKAVSLLCYRVGFWFSHPAYDLDGRSLNFDLLTFALGFCQFSLDSHGATSGDGQNIRRVVLDSIGHDSLNTIEVAAVVQVDEADTSLGVSLTSDPAFDNNRVANRLLP